MITWLTFHALGSFFLIQASGESTPSSPSRCRTATLGLCLLQQLLLLRTHAFSSSRFNTPSYLHILALPHSRSSPCRQGFHDPSIQFIREQQQSSNQGSPTVVQCSFIIPTSSLSFLPQRLARPPTFHPCPFLLWERAKTESAYSFQHSAMRAGTTSEAAYAHARPDYAEFLPHNTQHKLDTKPSDLPGGYCAEI